MVSEEAAEGAAGSFEKADETLVESWNAKAEPASFADQKVLRKLGHWRRAFSASAIVLTSCLASPQCLAWPWEVERTRTASAAHVADAANAPDKTHTRPSLPSLPTLVYCSEAAPVGFDPAQHDSGVDFVATAQTIYNRLIEYKRGTWAIEPGLADRWEVSADGRVYTFHLRRGVRFHTTPYFSPTREMNADDVMWTLHRLLDPDHPVNVAYPVYFSLFARMATGALIAACEKLDDHTVRITLKRPSPTFIKHLAMPFMSIMSEEYARTLLARGLVSEINTKPIGTGPFVFRSYTKGDTIRFDGNMHYWKKDAVKLSKLIFDVTPNASVRTNKLKRDECQVSVFPHLTDLVALRRTRDIAVLSDPGFNTSFLSYNVLHPALQKKAVRHALDMAIDKPAIIRGVYQDAARIAHTVMPPLDGAAIDSRFASGLASHYDPARAKAILSKAGYAKGLDLKLLVISIERPYNPNARLMAELIQADWAKIGIRASISVEEPGVLYSRIAAGKHDVALLGWGGDADDPDFWHTPMLACPKGTAVARHRWCDARLDALLQQASVTREEAARHALYRQIEAMTAEYRSISPIAHAIVYQPIRRSVEGMRIGPLMDVRFDGVTRQ
jgi:dipeptide transport system substrate-binding protein